MMQKWWDDLTAKGRDYRARFIPGGVKPYDTKEAALKDEFDEWLARVVCFCFSIEPTPFVKQTNRATAETSRQQSLEEGIIPIQKWVKGRIDECLRIQGLSDLEFAWVEEESIDPLVKAQINKLYLDSKVITPDEVRADIGMDPLTDEQKAELSPPMPDPLDPAAQDEPGDAQGDPAEQGKSLPKPDAAKISAATLVKKKTTANRLTRSLRY